MSRHLSTSRALKLPDVKSYSASLFQTSKLPHVWGLAPRYSAVLPYGRLKTLQDVTVLGILDWPHWQTNPVRKSLRALADEHAIPRDLWIVDTVCRILLTGRSTGSLSEAGEDNDASERSSRKRVRRGRRDGFAKTFTSTSTSGNGAAHAHELSELGTSPAVRAFLTSSTDAFTTLFSKGLPHVHRPSDETDDRMIHPKLLDVWKRVGGHFPPDSFIRMEREVQPLRARIVDAYSVWDGTGIGAPAGSGGEKAGTAFSGEEDEDAITASEAGHSVALRRRLEDLPWLLRLAAEFVHYYQLQPPRRVVTQLTVAYECRERTGPTEAAASSTAPAAADGHAASVEAGDSTGWTNSLHTITFEGCVEFSYSIARGGILGMVGSLVRYVSPLALVRPAAGWRVVDVDGQAGRHLGPDKSCTFSPLFEEARALAISQGGAYEAVMVESVQQQAAAIAPLPRIAAEEARAVLALRSALSKTPAGRGALLSVAQDAEALSVDLAKAATRDSPAAVGSVHCRVGPSKFWSPASHLLHLRSLQGSSIRVDGLLALQVSGFSHAAGMMQDVIASGERADARYMPWLERSKREEQFEGELSDLPEPARLARLVGQVQATQEQGPDSTESMTESVPDAETSSSGGRKRRRRVGGAAPAAENGSEAKGKGTDDELEDEVHEELSGITSEPAPLASREGFTEGPWPVRNDSQFENISKELLSGDESMHTLSGLFQGQFVTRVLASARARIAGLGGSTAVHILDAKTGMLLASTGSLEVIIGLAEHLRRYAVPQAVPQAGGASADSKEAKIVSARLLGYCETLRAVARDGSRTVQSGSVRAEWAEMRGAQDDEDDDDEDDEDEERDKRKAKAQGADKPEPAISPPASVTAALERAVELTKAPLEGSSTSAELRLDIHARVMAVQAAALAVLVEFEQAGLMNVRRDRRGEVIATSRSSI